MDAAIAGLTFPRVRLVPGVTQWKSGSMRSPSAHSKAPVVTAGARPLDAAFSGAYLLRSFLNRRSEYRQDPPIASVLRVADQIISRDPSDEIRPNAVMDRISELIEARDLDSVDALIESLRETANAHDAVTVRCVEVVVALHRGQFDAALSQINELLALALHETHLAVPLGQVLANIMHALDELVAARSDLPSSCPRPRLAPVRASMTFMRK